MGFARTAQVVGVGRQAAAGVTGELHHRFVAIADLIGGGAAVFLGGYFKIRCAQSAGIVIGGTAIFTGKHSAPPGEDRGGEQKLIKISALKTSYENKLTDNPVNICFS